MQHRRTIGLVLTLVSAAVLPRAVAGQDWTQREYPLAPPNAKNNFVAPYFDGFYQNPDGTWTLSFGFMNRNDEDLIEIPIGVNNRIEPREYDGVQPTSFPTVSYTGFGGPRERGVFGVIVPADFEGDVWWTVTTNGYTTKVPGRLKPPGDKIITGAYELSTGPMAGGSMRPAIKFDEDGEWGWGIEGVHAPEVLTTKVGEPVDVRFWARDRAERDLQRVNMTLWKYQGPVGGEIRFESLSPAPEDAPPVRRGRAHGPGPVATRDVVTLPMSGPAADQGHFTATFDTPGEYVIRIRIDNFNSLDSMPGQQCCWSNGYVTVRVTE